MGSTMQPQTLKAQSVRSADTPEGTELFERIAAIDARFRALGTALPDAKPPVEVWAGVLFRIRELLLLAPLAQIAEVLDPSAEITAIPGTKPWVLGVANNRGTLLPIFDLASLVYGGAPVRRDSDRVLAVRQGELPCGLMVSAAIGIRHFAVSDRFQESSGKLGILAPFAEASFALEGALVTVLALDRLLADPLLNAGGL